MFRIGPLLVTDKNENVEKCLFGASTSFYTPKESFLIFCNDLLYSFTRFQVMVAISGGNSFYFGWTSVFF